MSSGSCKLKEQSNITSHLWEGLTYEMLTIANSPRMWRSRNSHSLLKKVQNGTAILEDSLAGSYKAKHSFIIWFTTIFLATYPNKLKAYIHNKYYNFILNSSKVEASKLSFKRWMCKQTLVHPYNTLFIFLKVY